ncbi:MAG: flagellar export chaperone FliS [Alkalispirochaeta sp.]
MGYQQSSVQAYRQTSVKTATQGRVIVMLYEEAIRQIDLALDGIAGQDRRLDRINNAILKAQSIITELMVSLDMENGGEIAQNLFRLYMFFNDRLMEGNVKKDAAPLKEVKNLMGDLRDAWKQIENTVVAGRSASGGVNIAG